MCSSSSSYLQAKITNTINTKYKCKSFSNQLLFHNQSPENYKMDITNLNNNTQVSLKTVSKYLS